MYAFKPPDWQARTIEETFDLLGSGPQGLSQVEATTRLSSVGTNEHPFAKKQSKLLSFLRQFQSPLIYILLVAAVITLFFGSIVDALVIVIILMANAVIGFVQESRAEDVLESLKELTAPKSTVVRGAVSEIINARQIVPGMCYYSKQEIGLLLTRGFSPSRP